MENRAIGNNVEEYGFTLVVDWNPNPRPYEHECIKCGGQFVIDTVLVVAATAFGERIGVLGPCCLAPCALDRLQEECEAVEMEYGHA